MLNRRAQKVDWQLSGDARTPWEASVDAKRWQVRVNDFPEEKYLYSLLVDGVVTEDFREWRPCWTRPPLERMSEVELFVLRDFEQQKFEAEMETLASAENTASAKLVFPIRAWRAWLPRQGLPDGRNPRPKIFVIDCGRSSESVVSGLVNELPEGPWREQRAYVLIDTQGNIQQKFEVTVWSIEEELGCSVFAVVDGALRNLYVSVFYSDPLRVKRVEKIVVDGLQAVADDDDKTLSILSNALARYEQMGDRN